MINKNRSFNSAPFIARFLRNNQKPSELWKLRWKPVCGSTERELSLWLKNKPFSQNEFRGIFASRQLYGKGQNGKIWHSPKGGVWISVAIPFNYNTHSPELLGLAMAVSLSKCIEIQGVPVKIKWPNDLVFGDRKLAGFLPKIISRGSAIRYARIGIGLNIMNKVPPEGISLKEILGSSHINLEFWSAEVLFAIEEAIDLLNYPKLICAFAEQRLWATELLLDDLSSPWDINGFSKNGGLIVQRGSSIKTLSNWN